MQFKRRLRDPFSMGGPVQIIPLSSADLPPSGTCLNYSVESKECRDRGSGASAQWAGRVDVTV